MTHLTNGQIIMAKNLQQQIDRLTLCIVAVDLLHDNLPQFPHTKQLYLQVFEGSRQLRIDRVKLQEKLLSLTHPDRRHSPAP